MKLLAFEAATEGCSVAVYNDGEVCERFEVAPRRHAELMLPWAEALLVEAGISKKQLDAVAVSCGPGAFTGVRLGVAVAQGIALGLDKPIVPMSTLMLLAMRAPQAASHIVAAIDARMGEVYLGTFVRNEGGYVALTPEVVAAPEMLSLPEGVVSWVGVGTGFAAQEGALQARWGGRLEQVDVEALPHAGDLVRWAAVAYSKGAGIAPELVEPAYLRNQVALTLEEQQAARLAKAKQ